MMSERPTVTISTPAGDLRVALSFDAPFTPAQAPYEREERRPEPIAHVRFERLTLHRVTFRGTVDVRLAGKGEAGYSYVSRPGTLEDPTWKQRDKVAEYVAAAVTAHRASLLGGDLARQTRAYERDVAVARAEEEVEAARAKLAAALAALEAAQAMPAE